MRGTGTKKAKKTKIASPVSVIRVSLSVGKGESCVQALLTSVPKLPALRKGKRSSRIGTGVESS